VLESGDEYYARIGRSNHGKRELRKAGAKEANTPGWIAAQGVGLVHLVTAGAGKLAG